MSDKLHQCRYYGDGYDDKMYTLHCDDCGEVRGSAIRSSERSDTQLRLARIEHVLEVLLLKETP